MDDSDDIVDSGDIDDSDNIDRDLDTELELLTMMNVPLRRPTLPRKQ